MLMRIKFFLNPIEFVLYKGSMLLKRHLSLYSEAKREAALKHPEAFPSHHDWFKIHPSSTDDTLKRTNCIKATELRNFYITEELRKSNLLHPAFYMNQDNKKLKKKNFNDDVPIELNIGVGTKPSKSELKYLRFISTLVVNKLLDEKSKAIPTFTSLARELIVSSVFIPVINLVNCDNLNGWIMNGVDAMKNKGSHTQDLNTQTNHSSLSPDNGVISNEESLTVSHPITEVATSMVPKQDEIPVHELTPLVHELGADLSEMQIQNRISGVPPTRFRPTQDRSWRHLAGNCDEQAAEVWLAGEQAGAFLIRKTRPHGHSSGGGSLQVGCDDESFALSYVASSTIIQQRHSDNQEKKKNVNDEEDEDEGYVVHALIRCNPNSFEYCGVASSSSSSSSTSSASSSLSSSSSSSSSNRAVHDPRLVDRGHELLDPFASLNSLLSTLDDICTYGLVFYPEDPDDIHYWESVEQKTEQLLEPSTSSLSSVPASASVSRNNSLQEENVQTTRDDVQMKDDGELNSHAEIVQSIKSNEGPSPPDDIKEDDLMAQSSIENDTMDKENIVQDEVLELKLAKEEIEDEGETAAGLFAEQERHVLLIDLQAAVENVEEYDARAIINATALANEKTNKSTLFSRKKSSNDNHLLGGQTVGTSAINSYNNGVSDHHWNHSEGISHLGRLLVALDAVLAHGFKENPGHDVGIEESPTFFMENWSKNLTNTNAHKLTNDSNQPGSGVFLAGNMRAEDLDYFSKHGGHDELAAQVCGGDGATMMVVQEGDEDVAGKGVKDDNNVVGTSDALPIMDQTETDLILQADDRVNVSNVALDSLRDQDAGRVSAADQPTKFYHTYLICEDDGDDQNNTPSNQVVDIDESQTKRKLFNKKSKEKKNEEFQQVSIYDSVRQVLNVLAPIAPMAVDSGVDVAGRGWIVAALSSGLLKDRLYRLIADPRRTRDFYDIGAVVREPNDSSRLLWLLERLSFLSTYSNQIPKLYVLLSSLEIDGHDLLASRSLVLVQQASLSANTSSNRSNGMKLPAMFQSAFKTIDSALTFNNNLQPSPQSSNRKPILLDNDLDKSQEEGSVRDGTNMLLLTKKGKSFRNDEASKTNHQSQNTTSDSSLDNSNGIFEPMVALKSFGSAAADTMAAPVKFVTSATHRSVISAAAAAAAAKGIGGDVDLDSKSRYSLNGEFAFSLRTKNENAIFKFLYQESLASPAIKSKKLSQYNKNDAIDIENYFASSSLLDGKSHSLGDESIIPNSEQLNHVETLFSNQSILSLINDNDNEDDENKLLNSSKKMKTKNERIYELIEIIKVLNQISFKTKQKEKEKEEEEMVIVRYTLVLSLKSLNFGLDFFNFMIHSSNDKIINNDQTNITTVSILKSDFLNIKFLSNLIIYRENELSQIFISSDRKRFTFRILTSLLNPTHRIPMSGLKERHILRLHGSKVSFSMLQVEQQHNVPSDQQHASSLSDRGGVLSEAMSSLSAATSESVTLYEIQVTKKNSYSRVRAKWKIKRRYSDFRNLHSALLHQCSRSQLHHLQMEHQNSGLRGVFNKSANTIELDSNTSYQHSSNKSDKLSQDDPQLHTSSSSSSSLGSRVSYALPVLPPKRAFGNTEKEFVLQRRKKLSEYLEVLLSHPVFGESHELVVFLDAHRDREPKTNLSRLSSSFQEKQVLDQNMLNEMQSSKNNSVQTTDNGTIKKISKEDNNDEDNQLDHEEDEASFRDLGISGGGGGGLGGGILLRGMQQSVKSLSSLVPSSKLKQEMGKKKHSIKSNFETSSQVHDDTNVKIKDKKVKETTINQFPMNKSACSKEIDENVLKKIQQLIYLIVKELFDLNRTNLVRRNFVSFLRKSVKVMFTNKISKSISNLSEKFGNDETTGHFLDWLVNTIWSEPGHIMGPRAPLPLTNEIYERQILIRNEFVHGIPISFSSLLGRMNCDEAAMKLYEFLQCSVLIRSLLYCALDLFWKQLFPDDSSLSNLYGGKHLDWEENQHHKEN